MDSQPEAPKKAHSKNGSKVSTKERGISNEFDFDAKVLRATGRRPSRSSTGIEGEGELQRTASVKRAGVGMVPKLSNSPADPLNWPKWRKELAFGSLMLGAAVIGILKTLLVTVNSVIASELSVDYMSATALTGAPIMFGAFAGLKSQMISHSFGKRGIYLGSSLLMLIGALWNMHVYDSYAQFMVARIFQGIGWGMFEALISSSIADMFFVHERTARTNAYNVISIWFTWGSPILGGYISQSNEGFRNQIMIVNVIQAVSILLLIFATPETTFDRTSSQQPHADIAPSKSALSMYIETLKLSNSHSTSKFTIAEALRPLRALAAPSTILTTLLTAPLLASSFGAASSLSLLFAAMPTFLFPARIGYIFILPLVFSLLAYSLSSFVTHLRIKPPHQLADSGVKTLTVAGPGMLIGAAGLLAFGLYTSTELMPEIEDNGTIFALNIVGLEISLKTVSSLLGLLISGAVMLQYSGSTYLSTFVPASGIGESEVAGAHHVLQEIIIGIWVIGMPMWISGDGALFVVAGLKNTTIALGVLSIVFGSSVGAVLWVKGSALSVIDSRVLGKRAGSVGVDGGPIQRWKTNDSFLEA
ncbi:major facilitator superfamily domain-containing protein [Rhexocercosporidium sp. MPI-PUGE-AT-0058]|nr:major facilitator superfamily domain-containing protein [Rhexocercosporidium sp. MPI-PUGE-AT-0058]